MLTTQYLPQGVLPRIPLIQNYLKGKVTAPGDEQLWNTYRIQKHKFCLPSVWLVMVNIADISADSLSKGEKLNSKGDSDKFLPLAEE